MTLPLLGLEKVALEYADGLAVITLNDPGAMNVLGPQLGSELLTATTALGELTGLRAVLLEANGKHFCGGGDLKAMQACFASDPGEFFRSALASAHAAMLNLSRLEVPVVSAVQGYAAGAGANLPFVADLVIAADDAVFFQAFTQVGVAVDCGGAWFWPRAMGDKRALDYLLTGRKLPALEALQHGLVSRIVPVAELRASARALAGQLAQGPTVGYAQIKRLVAGHSQRTLEEHLQAELDAQLRCSATGDFQRGVNAFLAKEQPEFEGA